MPKGTRTVLVLLAVMYAGTLALLAVTWTTDNLALQMQLSGLGVTVLYAVCVWHSLVTRGRRATIGFFGLALVISFAAEYVGDNYGWIFGAYHYSGSLGPRLGGVPVLVVLTWGTVVYAAMAIVDLLGGRRVPTRASGRAARLADAVLVAAGAGLLACAWDLMADPLAVSGLWSTVVGVDPWWSWVDGGPYLPDLAVGPGAGPGIPLTNFAGWWAVPFVVVLLSRLTLPGDREPGQPVDAGPAPATIAPRRVAAVPLLVYGYLFVTLIGGLAEMSRLDPGLVQAVLIGACAMGPVLVIGALAILRQPPGSARPEPADQAADASRR